MNAPLQNNAVNQTLYNQTTLSSKKKKTILTATLMLVLFQQVLMLIVPIAMKVFLMAPYTWKYVFIGNLMQWDAHWLKQISKNGYTNIAHTAFFPLYPLATHVVHVVTSLGYSTSALLVSLVSLLCATYVFGVYTCEQFSLRTSMIAMALLLLFPTAFFFRAGYTESMFFCFSILAVYQSSHKRFISAGAFITLAALTRNTGALLCIVLLLDYLDCRKMDWRFWKSTWWKKLNVQALGLFLPIIGLLMYFTWLKIHTGYFLAFLQAEKLWHRTFSFPWITIKNSVIQLFLPRQLGYLPYHLLELLSFVYAVVALLYGARYVKRSKHLLGNFLYLILVLWACTTAPARTGPKLSQGDFLLSMSRFVLMMYPVFMYYADRIRTKTTATIVIATSAILFCIVYGTSCSGSFIA